jgi:hypothetical protein
MDLGGLPVHHGLATMAGLGLTGPTPFGCFDRRELTVMKGKGRGEQRGSHQGFQRPGKRQSEVDGSCWTTNSMGAQRINWRWYEL